MRCGVPCPAHSPSLTSRRKGVEGRAFFPGSLAPQGVHSVMRSSDMGSGTRRRVSLVLILIAHSFRWNSGRAQNCTT